MTSVGWQPRNHQTPPLACEGSRVTSFHVLYNFKRKPQPRILTHQPLIVGLAILSSQHGFHAAEAAIQPPGLPRAHLC